MCTWNIQTLVMIDTVCKGRCNYIVATKVLMMILYQLYEKSVKQSQSMKMYTWFSNEKKSVMVINKKIRVYFSSI
jgi:hypothetical protein